MSIQSPVGTLDIKNATLRVGKLEVSNIQGVDTALNVTRANSVLIYDDQASTTTFTGTTSSAGVRDTVNGYLDVADGYVYWGQKLPNAWVMDFEMDIRSGTNAGPLYANVFSTTNTGGDGYSFTFNDSNDKISLYYDGTLLTEATVTGLFTATENWQKVVINYERGMIAISLGGSRKFYYKDIERETPYVNGEYVSFSSASTDGRKIRTFKVTNGDKWTYSGESNITYTHGSLGIGVVDPTATLDVHGTANVGALTATSISGPLSGNATTAAALETARTIGGVSFDGSANINLPGVNTTGNQDTSGNADTAAALETARTIGGVSFDGSANINLPGVNTTGNQDTSGNAATATALATARTIGGVSFDGTADINLPGVNTSGTQDTSGNAATATALATARTIGGVSFDGSGNINLPGVNTTGNQDTSGNATTATALETARNINGVSFDGTGNITITANTPNTLTRGLYLTGSDFDGSAATTWAVDATTTNTVNKIVARDGNGDIFGRYLRGTYVNISHSAATRSTDTVFYSSTDDYIRKTNATGMRASLNVPTRTGDNASGTWGIDITGNAATATTLATARAINGVNFDGSAAITVNGTNYDVNDSWLRELDDNAHFKQYGNTRQMVFRTDGTTQYASDVGAYPFAWMYGGDAASNRRMLLNTSGQLWCSNYGWLHDKFMARTQVFSDTNADASFIGQTIDYNASGSQTTTTDTVHRALLIDVDSSATGGDTNHEHRLYGIYNDVRHSGDSDLVYGMYSYTRSDHTSGQTTELRAGDFIALASGTGTNTNIYGLNSYALKDAGSTGTTANMYGVRGEVEVDAGTCTTAYAFQSHIDHDGGTITTGYLYYGSYSGTVGTKWGVYITGETKNYFSGNVGVGTTSPVVKLDVRGDIMFSGSLYQLNRGLGGEIVFDRGGYRIHIFKASGIFTSYGVTTADVLLVAGGGGGGNDNAGGGGAGGLIFRPGMTISNGEKAVVIGQGGIGSPTQTVLATDGSNSTFNGLTALGGGNGAIGYANATYGVAGTGGSGGGGQGEWSGGYSGANGLQPSQSGDSGTYGYGNRGGNGNSGGGGGGGAGAVGNNYNGSTGGDGGEGKYFATSGGTTYDFLTMYGYCGVGDNNPKAIEGQNWTNRLYFAGGGGGGNGNDNTGRAVGGNGGGGGALGTYIPSSAPDGGPSDPKNGLPNTGGGGAGGTASGSHQWEHGGNGGTGVCIIRYAI